MPSPLAYLRSFAPLKPSQWACAFARLVEARRSSKPLAPAPADLFSTAAKAAFSGPAPFHGGLAGAELVREVTRGDLTLLHETKLLGQGKIDWRLGNRSEGRLWTLTLHTHGWLHELSGVAPGLFETGMKDWIERCPYEAPGAGTWAWDPYVVAGRLVYWCRSHSRLGHAFWNERPDFEKAYLASLWQQAEYLSGHVEWDKRGNHLIRDALGLAAAGCFLKGAGDKPDGWSAQAAELSRAQAVEQVLADGWHFERSPFVHLTVLEDLIQLSSLLPEGDARCAARETALRMLEPIAWARHPDSLIPLFNDATLNGARPPAWFLNEGAKCLGLPVMDPAPRAGLKVFPDAGWVVWHGETISLFFDAGPLGPDEQPGHGHADHLTLEASIGGGRLWVDPGVFAYDDDERRRYDRSTGAHNTVSVDGESSSELWGAFRVGRRARARHLEVRDLPGGFVASSEHDGYDHMPGKPRHGRTVEVMGDVLRVKDTVAGKGMHSLSGGWLLAPGWEAGVDGSLWRLAGFDRVLEMKVSGREDVQLSVEDAEYHPDFGVEIPVSRLVWRWAGHLPFSVEFVLKES